MSIIYGSPLFLSSSSQNADLPPLLDNFKAYIGTTPPEPETITLADIPVSDAETETIVNLKESDGKLHPYLYLSNNHNNTNGALLLRKNISVVKGVSVGWAHPDDSRYYRYWCENEFLTTILDSSVSSQVIEGNIKAAFTQDSGSSSLGSATCFALSLHEYGLKIGDSYIKDEGPQLPYFSTNQRRIAYNDAGGIVEHYTRTSVTATGFYIDTNGTNQSDYDPMSTPRGLRPAIFLPFSFKLIATANEDGSYDMYEEQAVQTLAEADGIITIAADKMEEFRAKELAGAVWVYGDHIPKNVNDGTKIQLTREEITRPDGEPYITLDDILASDAEIETIINIKESDGELHPYLYLSNDYLGSGAGLLLRKDCYQKGVWHNTGNIGVFNGSQFDVWCSNTFPTLLDTSISNILMEVDLPTKTTGAIRRKCFTLSNTEYGGDMYPAEGTALPYFKDNVRRQSVFNGVTVDYWTRSKYDVTQAYFIGLTGGLGQDMNTLSLGYRPAFCLPLTFKLKATPNENGSYDMYGETSVLSTFASSEFIVEKSVLWEQTKDFHVRQFTYNSKKQYQTMLEGATANIIYSEFPEEPTDYLNCAEIPNSTEYEIPENGWFRIDAIGGGGTGGTGINFDTASWGYAATCGGGGIGGHSRSEVALNKGDILKVVIDSGNVTVSCDSKGININALRGSDGNKPSGYTQGSGGLGGEANGGNIKNDRGQNGNSGYNTSNFGYNNVLNGGEEIQKIIQINRDISFTALGGKAVDYKRTLINSATIANNASLGSVAKVFISRGNTNIASPSQASAFSILPKNNSVEATWENSGDPVQTGTMLVYNTSHVPKSPSDGVAVDIPLTQPVMFALNSDSEELQEDSKKQSYTIKGVPNDKPIFVALFPYDKDRKYGLAKQEVEIPREHSWYDKQQELEAEVKTVKAEMADYQSYYTTTQEVLK